MNEKDFENKMHNMRKPDVEASASYMHLKLALMNTKRSSVWGTGFLIIPVLFLCCVSITYLFHWKLNFNNEFIEFFARLDKNSYTAWLTPLLFVLLPAVGAIFNLLSIMHFAYDKAGKELLVSIKLKWWNICLAVISLGIISIILLYAITENAGEAAIQKYLH